MKLKRLLALLFCAALLTALCSCKFFGTASSSEATSSAPPVVDDPNWPSSARDVTLEKKPERIISLSPATTELVCELGARDRLIGVSDSCDYPADVTALSAFGSPARPDLEGMKKADAQLVVSSVPLTQADTAWLQQQGVFVLVLPRVDKLSALEERYLSAGVLLDGLVDGEANATRVFDQLMEKRDVLIAAAARVELRYGGIWLRSIPLLMATGDTFEGVLMTELLAIDNEAALYTGWEYPSEKAADLYPDLIFYDQSIDPEFFKGTQIYNTTDAYKKDRLFSFDSVVFERQSGRMFDELMRMFATAYPDIPLGAVASEPEESSTASPSSSDALSGIIEEPVDE